MKMMQGLFFFASSNSSQTLFAPTPTNISSKSLPVQYMKLVYASPAIARAIKVLPVPGFPNSKTPLCNFAPLS